MLVQKIKGSYKALTVFVLGFGSFLVATISDPAIAAVLPQGVAQWLTMIGVPAVLAAGTWLVRNQPTVEEAAKQYDMAVARATDKGV